MNKEKTEFWSYISLGILGMLGSAGTILADAFFVSNQLGSTGLAAMNIAMGVFGLMNGTGLLFGIGGATHYTIASAREDKHEANQVFTLSFFTALTLGAAFALAGLLASRHISYLLGADAETIVMCDLYLKTVLCFAPAFILNHLLMAFVRNDGAPGLSMRAMMTGSVTNIVLDYLFMYPCGMGILGAAVATGLAALIGIGISCLHFCSARNHLRFVRVKIDLIRVLRIASLGVSAFITEASSGVVLVVFNLLILRIAGNTGVAAYGIVANLALMILAVMSGISHGIQPLLSRRHGMRDRKSVERLYGKGIRLVLLIGGAVFAAASVCAPALTRCFNAGGDGILHQLAERGIRLYFIGFLFVGHNYLTAAYFSATERPQKAFFIAIFRGFIGITAAVCLMAMCLGMTGIWLSFPTVEAITVGLCLALQFNLKAGVAGPVWKRENAE